MLWIEKNLLLRFYDYPILNFFLNLSAILPGEMNVATDAYNIAPVQCHRWILLLFWLFLLSTIYIVLNNKNKSIKNTGFKTVLFSASIVMFVLSLLPFSSISGNYRAHLRSLNVNNELHTAADKIDEPANFLVEKYSMDIYAYLNLQFRVQMQLGEGKSDEYKFTLFNTFDIYKIKDQNGKPLEYKKENHYLTVYPKEDLTTIEIWYGGAGEPFYGDFSGLYLGGGLPFFPMPGFVPVYTFSDSQNSPMVNPVRMANDTIFDVNVHTLGNVYSSLPSIGHNAFHGTADSFFLLKGFYEIKEFNDSTIIYPPFSAITEHINNDEALQESLSLLAEKLGKEKYDQRKRCIFIYSPISLGFHPIDIYSNYISILNLDPIFIDTLDIYLEPEELENDRN